MAHYINCISCDAYYSADGNPCYLIDAGDMLCEDCYYESFIIEKKSDNGHTVFTVCNEYSTDIHQEFCIEIALALETHKITYTRTMSEGPDLTDTFRIPDVEICLHKLAGIDVDRMFYTY